MKQKLVVIGAGMASGRVLEHLRERAPDQYDITLFNAEPRGNYNRIMLSPVLSGEKTYAEIVTHDDDWYAQNEISCRFGEHVVGIDREAKTVTGQNGTVGYDKLLIATGSAPFIIPVPGKDLPGVISYRDLDDTNAMVEASAKGGKAVVIGGGLLGLEAAAGLALRGMEVTVLHLMGHLMERQLDEAAGYLLKKDLEKRGITVLLEDGLEYERLRGVMIKGTATLVDDEKGLHDLARAVVEHNQPGLDPDLLDVAAAHLTVKRTGVMVEPHKVVSWDHTKLADLH